MGVDFGQHQGQKIGGSDSTDIGQSIRRHMTNSMMYRRVVRCRT